MTIKITVPFPSLKEEFTVEATCQKCADAAAKELADIAEVVEWTGKTATMHAIGAMDGRVAIISNKQGERVNAGMQLDNV